MSLEAWGDCDPAADQPMRECRICDGSGEVQEVRDSLLVCYVCAHCHGAGEVPDEYDPLPDDVI